MLKLAESYAERMFKERTLTKEDEEIIKALLREIEESK